MPFLNIESALLCLRITNLLPVNKTRKSIRTLNGCRNEDSENDRNEQETIATFEHDLPSEFLVNQSPSEVLFFNDLFKVPVSEQYLWVSCTRLELFQRRIPWRVVGGSAVSRVSCGPPVPWYSWCYNEFLMRRSIRINSWSNCGDHASSVSHLHQQQEEVPNCVDQYSNKDLPTTHQRFPLQLYTCHNNIDYSVMRLLFTHPYVTKAVQHELWSATASLLDWWTSTSKAN